MKVDRSITKVIDKVVSLVPDDFERKDDLVSDLGYIKRDAGTTAPEIMHIRWNAFVGALDKHIPYPTQTDWARKIEDVMMGNTSAEDIEEEG